MSLRHFALLQPEWQKEKPAGITAVDMICFKENKIYYKPVYQVQATQVLEQLDLEMGRLDRTPEIETTILILCDGFKDFRHRQWLDDRLAGLVAGLFARCTDDAQRSTGQAFHLPDW